MYYNFINLILCTVKIACKNNNEADDTIDAITFVIDSIRTLRKEKIALCEKSIVM